MSFLSSGGHGLVQGSPETKVYANNSLGGFHTEAGLRPTTPAEEFKLRRAGNSEVRSLKKFGFFRVQGCRPRPPLSLSGFARQPPYFFLYNLFFFSFSFFSLRLSGNHHPTIFMKKHDFRFFFLQFVPSLYFASLPVRRQRSDSPIGSSGFHDKRFVATK